MIYRKHEINFTKFHESINRYQKIGTMELTPIIKSIYENLSFLILGKYLMGKLDIKTSWNKLPDEEEIKDTIYYAHMRKEMIENLK